VLGRRSIVRVALVTAIVLLIPLVGMSVSDEWRWSLGDFVFAGVLLVVTGVLLELAVSKPRGVVYRAAAIAVGLASILLGSADDAPGLVLFGGLVVLVSALGGRRRPVRAQRL
jgi:hypothetical protein